MADPGSLHSVQVTSGRKTAVVTAFGRYLEELRGRRKRPQVSRMLWDWYQVKCEPSMLGHYEKGRVMSPDPVVLVGLAKLYDSDVERLIAVLKADREAHRNGRELGRADVDRILQEVDSTRARQAAAAASHLAEARQHLFKYSAEFIELANRFEPAATVQAEATPQRAAGGRRRSRVRP